MRRLITVSPFAPWVLIAVGLLSGCATQAPPAHLPPPPLQLLSSGRLEIADDCTVRSGVMYRTSYVVQGDGRVADVQPPHAPACLRSALTQWVDTFQYAPPGEPVATVVDWMGVSGSRLP